MKFHDEVNPHTQRIRNEQKQGERKVAAILLIILVFGLVIIFVSALVRGSGDESDRPTTPSTPGATTTGTKTWAPPKDWAEWVERKRLGTLTHLDREWERGLPIRNISYPIRVRWPATPTRSPNGRYILEVAHVRVTFDNPDNFQMFELPESTNWDVEGEDYTLMTVTAGGKKIYHSDVSVRSLSGRLFAIRPWMTDRKTLVFELRREVKKKRR